MRMRLAVYPPRSMIEESDSRAAEVEVDSVLVAQVPGGRPRPRRRSAGRSGNVHVVREEAHAVGQRARARRTCVSSSSATSNPNA